MLKCTTNIGAKPQKHRSVFDAFFVFFLRLPDAKTDAMKNELKLGLHINEEEISIVDLAIIYNICKLHIMCK